MTSNRPYLIRALHEWISDNDLTPHLLVNAEQPGVEVPGQFVEQGQIVLNIAYHAVHGLEQGDEWIAFSARFSGKSTEIFIPVDAVLGLYCKENGQGMMFPPDDTPDPDPDKPSGDDTSEVERPQGPPSLKVVK